MEEILKTTLLEYKNCTFIIDLVRHSGGKTYIRLEQRIHDDVTNRRSTIKINPLVLKDLQQVLDAYQKLIPTGQENSPNKRFPSDISTHNFDAKGLTQKDKLAIKQRHLKGVSIQDLTLQFNCKADLIKHVLHSQHIVIEDNTPAKSRYYKKFRKKKE
jgi:hypothetical protein